MTDDNPRQTVLKQISKDLKEFDFQNFDPRKDKTILMNKLQSINSQLGKLLKGYA
jgi:hypothetical protein